RPERLALDDRLLHKARPHLLRRAFRLRSRRGFGLWFLALRRIDFCFNDFEWPYGGGQLLELVYGDIIFVGLKAPLDLLAQFENGVDQILFHQLLLPPLPKQLVPRPRGVIRCWPRTRTEKEATWAPALRFPSRGKRVDNFVSCRASGGL